MARRERPLAPHLWIEIKYLAQVRLERGRKHERIIQCVDRISLERFSQRGLQPIRRCCIVKHFCGRRTRGSDNLSGLAHRASPFLRPVERALCVDAPKAAVHPA